MSSLSCAIPAIAVPRRFSVRHQPHPGKFHVVQRILKHFDHDCQVDAGSLHRKAFLERREVHEAGKGHQSIAG
jgi:hypothetical protein